MKNIKLPFGSEFSPSQVHLPLLLKLCSENEGSIANIEKEAIDNFFTDKDHPEQQKVKFGMNCRLGLQCYLILDSSGNFTEAGKHLYDICEDEELLYKEFAKHILLNVNGLKFVNALDNIKRSGEIISLATMPEQLKAYGIEYPKGGKHPSILRLWLDKAGITNKRWEINREKLNEVLGTEDQFDTLSTLTVLQRAFLKALINTGVTEPQSTTNVVKIAEADYGIKFPDKSLPKLVLNQLIKNNLILAKKTTGGRGAKPFLVQLHPDVNPEVLLPSLAQIKRSTDPKLYALLQKPIAEILEEIKSTDTYISGLALEALAFKLMQILDMEYVTTRLKGEVTGGAEVDLVFESSRLVYSRWQIQCKNTKKVSLDPVAKEVGLTHFLKSNVIVIATTGSFSSEAIRYSNKIMRDSNLCIVLLDGKDIQKVSENPANIVDILNKKAKETMSLKRIDL